MAQDTGLETLGKAGKALALVDDPPCLDQAVAVSYPHILGFATGLKEGLGNVQGGGSSSGGGSGDTSCHDVGHGIVVSCGVEDLAEVFVGGDFDGFEGDGHGEGGGVGDVEGAKTFGSVDLGCAVHDAPVDRSVDLHSLLDHVKWVHQSIVCGRGTGTSSSYLQVILF